MNSGSQSILKATLAATRLHRSLEQYENIFADSRIDVFEAVYRLDIPLLFRPLDHLLGAFLNEPSPGVLVTTKRPLSVQRFTAAHELGHQQLNHAPSLDGESILGRSPYWGGVSKDLRELEANAFAAAFLLPRHLVAEQCKRHNWTGPLLATPEAVYQLSLRLGASFEATAWALYRYDFLSLNDARHIAAYSPRTIKEEALRGYKPKNFWGDVWVLDEHDRETRIAGSRSDLFVFRLAEHSGGGYVWNFDDLIDADFRVVQDQREDIHDRASIGSNLVRRVTAESEVRQEGTISLKEARPWQLEDTTQEFSLRYDLTGPKEAGASRFELTQMLVEANA